MSSLEVGLMALMINRLKLSAAASSMHQFCPIVRGVFPEEQEADEAIVESLTLFLYLNLAKDVFGRRFTRRLGKRLCRYLRFTSARDAESHLGRIRTKVGRARRVADALAPSKSPEVHFQNHITSVVQTMLSEVGADDATPEEHGQTFVRFDQTVRRMRDHLMGIRNQNGFLMK